MAERTSGLHRLVTIPAIYAAIQNVLGGAGGRKQVARLLFTGLEGKKVLEVGCGPGSCVPYLSHVAAYTGIDWNPHHIETAQLKYGSNVIRFIRGDLADPELIADIGAPDAVIGIGILHHLDDMIAADLLARVSSLLASGGRYIGIEPVLHARQNPMARLLKALDSGRNIRTEPAYRLLFGTHYVRVNTTVRTDLMRVPYSHCLIDATIS
ncbi:class I SAM-dependent methyltransferase [Shinella sp.]|uniref:class I SAM-dependent methyltransferase n=1 Tax=Shinella sp. TaxID=1870904 RepID=UPI0039E72AE3